MGKVGRVKVQINFPAHDIDIEKSDEPVKCRQESHTYIHSQQLFFRPLKIFLVFPVICFANNLYPSTLSRFSLI